MSDPRAGPQIVAPLLTPVAAPPRWSADPAGAGAPSGSVMRLAGHLLPRLLQ